ncbi:MAG: DEAD/DEAH box helicase [Bradymonadaceae bacterium]
MTEADAVHRLSLDGVESPGDRPLEMRFDGGTVVVDGLDRRDAPSDRLKWDDRIAAHRCRAVAYRRVLGELLRAGWTVEDCARAYDDLQLELSTRFEPYEHQSEALAAWESAERRAVVVLPTGAGKTFVAQMAMHRVERSTLVVVPTIDLMNQWDGVLEEGFGVEIGRIGGGDHEVRDLTVVTYDSAAIHMEHLGGRFGFVVFDEVHHLPSDFYRESAESSIAPYRLGLTATPERSDGRHADLPELVGPIAYRQSIDDLSGDILADYETRRVEVPMSDDDKRRYRRARGVYRDFVEDLGIRVSSPGGWRQFLGATNRSERGRRALEAYRTQRRLALVHDRKVERLIELLVDHRDDRVLVFTDDNETVYTLSERVLVPSITHETGASERKEILDRFDRGEYRTIVTSKVLNEGIDVPKANVGIVLSGSGAVREHVQRLGRILRRNRGGGAVLYELVTPDTVERHVSRRRRRHDAYQ